MMTDYVFKDRNNVYFVVGPKKCHLTKESINEFGFIRLIRDEHVFLSLEGLKESKKFQPRQVEYFQFFVTDNIRNDFVVVNFRSAVLVNAKNIDSVFDVDKIQNKYRSQVIDRTKYANRESFSGLVIGSPDYKKLDLLDKPLENVDGLLLDYKK